MLECRIQSGEWLGEVGGLEAGAWSLGDMQSSLWGLQLISGSWTQMPPRSKSNIHISLLPLLFAVFLQRFLRHSLHKFRVLPGDLYRDRHSDGIRVKELHDHLSDTGRNI